MDTLKEARRNRRIEAKRLAILRASSRVLAREGIDRTRTRDIAQEADVAVGTIYNYFGSKQAIVIALTDLMQSKFAALTASLPAQLDQPGDAARTIRNTLDLVCDEAELIKGLAGVLWDQESRYRSHLAPGLQSLIGMIEADVQRGVAAGTLRNCNTREAALMLAGMIAAVSIPYLCGVAALPSAEERQQLAELVATVFLYGLAQRGGY